MRSRRSLLGNHGAARLVSLLLLAALLCSMILPVGAAGTDAVPSAEPTAEAAPSGEPTVSAEPTPEVTPAPDSEPSAEPSPEASTEPSSVPSAEPSPEESAEPSPETSPEPEPEESPAASETPSSPSLEPSAEPETPEEEQADPDAEISVMDISGPQSVLVGETIQLTGTSSSGCGYSRWSSSSSRIATVDSNGNVTGVSSGTVTITHTYCTETEWHWWSHENRSETYTVTVYESAQVFFLKTPTSDPDSNDVNQWSDNCVTYGGQYAVVNVADATWVDDKNVKDNVADFIVKWPDGSSGETWTLDKSTYGWVYKDVYDAYKTYLEEENNITGLTLDDIESITLVPYKISKNTASTPDKHIDCMIEVKCTKAYTARFYVQEPGGTAYKEVGNGFTYQIVGKVPSAINEVPTEVVDQIKREIERDGVTYVFDGWYRSKDGTKEVEWPYQTTTEDLDATGTVEFYAHYVPEEVTVTITKEVAGTLGDRTKSFGFSYWCGVDGEEEAFSLKHGEEKTIQVPSGTTLYLQETNAEKYDISAACGSTIVEPDEGVMCFTINTNTAITVTNTKNAVPDTGVDLDSLPYILMLSLAAGGAALLLRRRRAVR